MTFSQSVSTCMKNMPTSKGERNDQSFGGSPPFNFWLVLESR
jgi:hypothetical protein